MSAFDKTTIKISSATPGWNLDAWKYVPKRSSSSPPIPVIVMAHGLSANKLLGLAPYAEAYADLGYASIVFDYRRWGTSDGVPRNLINIKEQLEDYRMVIKFARLQPEFDGNRVILFGTSFSGGHALTLSAESELNIAATIAQCPYTGIIPSPTLNFTFIKQIAYAVADMVKLSFGFLPIYLPAVAELGELALLPLNGGVAGMRSLESQSGDFPNEVNASALFQIPFYKPYATASRINAPVVVIAPEDDNTCTLQGARDVMANVQNGKGELAVTPGGHYDVYHAGPHFQQSLQVQLAFLRKHVPA